MAVTSPDNLRTPDSGDQYALVQDLGVLASTTQAAITKRGNLYIGTGAQRTAFTTAPTGVHWQDTDGQELEYVRKSSGWRVISALGVTANSVAQRALIFPAPVQGDSVWRTDTGFQETYFTTYNITTNPGGTLVAGWYPTAGALPTSALFRSASTLTVASSTWTNLSSNSNWTSNSGSAQSRGVNYSNGFVIPVSGMYSISFAVRGSGSANPFIAGFSLNDAAVSSSTGFLVGASAAQTPTAFASGTTTRALVAGDVLRLWAYTVSPAFDIAPGSGTGISVAYLRPV